MPAGRYSVIGDEGLPVGTEAFRCAPGPMGWRYVSEVETNEHGQHHTAVDVVVDASWRIVRFHVRTSEHQLGVEMRDGSLEGTLDGESLRVGWGDEDHLDHLTPATNLITCRRLGRTSDIEVVLVDAFSLRPTRERQRYDLVGPEVVRTPVGSFDATRWRYRSLGSGWTSELWVAEDVVVRFDRIFELVEYDPGANGPRPR